jgi:hypothetical protein
MITYDDVKNDIWEVIKDKMDFVYEASSDCDVCNEHNDWEYDPEGFDYEPPTCNKHHDGDACRYFYADGRGYSQYDTPACVVGNWFVHANLTPEDLKARTWNDVEGQGIGQILKAAHFPIDEKGSDFLQLMQNFQDTGISWGVSFDRAVAKCEGNGAA